MRILFLNYEFPPLGGGAGNATYYLLKEFSKDPEIEVDLVTSSVDSFRVEKFSQNITIHFLDIGKKGNFHYQSLGDLLRYSFKAYFYSRKLKSKKKYDICQAFFGIPCGFIALKLGLPFVVSLRGSDIPFYNERFYYLDKIFFRYLSRKVWRKALAVTSLSYDMNKLAKRTDPQKEIEVIYNGIDAESFKPQKEILEKEKYFNILFVGRLIERKGAEYLLEAFGEISRKKNAVKLIIAGDGPLKEKYQRYVSENGLSGKVDFLGRVSHEKMPEVYQKSHIFVLPSLNEALGNVTSEALASGLPIITTDTGAAEFVDENGIIVKKESSLEIREAIEKLMANERLRLEMGEKSREKAIEMSWERAASQYIKIYKKNIG